MTDIVKWLNGLLADTLHMNPNIAGFLSTAILITAMILVAIGVN